VIAERDNFRVRVTSHHRSGYKSRHVDAASCRSSASSMSGDGRMYGTRNVREDVNLFVDLWHIMCRNFHRVQQCLPNFGRHCLSNIVPCGQQLIGEDVCLLNQVCCSQTVCHNTAHLFVVEDTVSSKRVQVHPRCLPGSVSSSPFPVYFRQWQCGQHLERNIRSGHLAGVSVSFKLFVLPNNFRQLVLAVGFANDVGEPRVSRS